MVVAPISQWLKLVVDILIVVVLVYAHGLVVDAHGLEVSGNAVSMRVVLSHILAALIERKDIAVLK